MDFILNTLETKISVPRIANVHFFDFPQGYETVWNSHPFRELIFVANGRITVTSEEYTGDLDKNECIMHGTDRKHAFSCPNHSETTVVVIGFECTSNKLDFFSKQPIRLDDSEIKKLAEIVKEGRNVFLPPYNVPTYNMKKKKRQAFGSEQLLRAHLECFLVTLLRKHELRDEDEEREDTAFEIEEIIKYIDANFLEKITLRELSFLFHTNRSTLCKSFKAATGLTLSAYISRKKTELAKEMLRTSRQTVAQIAEQLHFDSTAYFCAFFKRETGMTPAIYRKNEASVS